MMGFVRDWTASWESIHGTRPQWLAEKKVKMLVQFTLERQPYLKDVPTLVELAPPDKKDVAEFVSLQVERMLDPGIVRRPLIANLQGLRFGYNEDGIGVRTARLHELDVAAMRRN